MTAARRFAAQVGLVAGKDLRIEWQSRVATNQIAPFSLLVIVLFGLALSGNTVTLRDAAPGLLWITILFTALLAVQRSANLEQASGALEHLRLTTLPPSAVYIGKAIAVAVQLLLLTVLLTATMIVLYDITVDKIGLYVVTAIVAVVAIAAAGTLYGVLASGLAVRDTILPLLLLPVLAPVLIAATRATSDALGEVKVSGWSWLGLLSLLAVSYTLIGILTYGVLVEDS
jgi:heme exporter protein B